MTAEIPQGTSQESVRRILMPPKEVIVQQLKDAGIIGVLPQTDIFYETFAGYIGGRDLPPGGFSLFWDVAGVEQDYSKNAHRKIKIGVEQSFDRIVDAIVPDQEVAAQAKEYRREFLEDFAREVEKERKEVEDLFLNLP